MGDFAPSPILGMLLVYETLALPGEAPPSIVLGYGSVTESNINRGIAILGGAIRDGC
jgi:hypothetical protein